MENTHLAGDYRTAPRMQKAASAVASRGQRSGPSDVDAFLHLLARAVRQFHTYPQSSPICVDAIEACLNAVRSLEEGDSLVFRISPRELFFKERSVGAGTIVEQELASRLHQAHVAVLSIARDVPARDLSRLCSDLIRCRQHRDTKTTLADLLAEHGVDTITIELARRPEVLDIGAPDDPRRTLVEHERRRHEVAVAPDQPVNYLYPPDKGWIRLDPAVDFSTISLVDLAVLVDNPSDLAGMLLRLTDDDVTGTEAEARALEQKFGDVATLFGSLDPRLARVMFAKLARAVLDLGAERREDLLRRTILPGLLDGRLDGVVLRDFPDVDLAEALCLLLDLETAAPDVLTAAVARLDLPAERKDHILPVLESRLNARESADRSPDDSALETGRDRYARRLIRVETANGKTFTDFAAFDLSIDAETATVLSGIQTELETGDPLIAQIQCLWNLVRLEPNRGRTESFLHGATTLLERLETDSRWKEVAEWGTRFRQFADAVQRRRPDTSEAIAEALLAYWTPSRVVRLTRPCASEAAAQDALATMVEAFGCTMVPALVAVIEDPDARPLINPVVQIMCRHACMLAPALGTSLRQCRASSARIIVKVLGFAGQGCETIVAGALDHEDDQTAREALRALARIGTAEAAAAVGRQICEGRGSMPTAAAEALCRFPEAVARAQLRQLLEQRSFVIKNPQLAARLLSRVGPGDAHELEPTLAELVRLRYRFWSPALMRVAITAQHLRKS